MNRDVLSATKKTYQNKMTFREGARDFAVGGIEVGKICGRALWFCVKLLFALSIVGLIVLALGTLLFGVPVLAGLYYFGVIAIETFLVGTLTIIGVVLIIK